MNYYSKKRTTQNPRRQGAPAPAHQEQGDQFQPFWITCPECKHKFSVPAEWVFKYLERIGLSVDER